MAILIKIKQSEEMCSFKSKNLKKNLVYQGKYIESNGVQSSNREFESSSVYLLKF